MNTFQLIAAISVALFFAHGAYQAQRRPSENETSASPWVFPASVSVAFLALSVFTVMQEGPVGFWQEHTESWWGIQVWCDLLLAFSIAWIALLPRARALNMNLYAWFGLICASGSIGILAMLARIYHLERDTAITPAGQPVTAPR